MWFLFTCVDFINRLLLNTIIHTSFIQHRQMFCSALHGLTEEKILLKDWYLTLEQVGENCCIDVSLPDTQTY